ncbi:hypothetical protein DPMN_050096 [Dreissena polymorpha]|uniref:Uncharacterized protein n=1 Tax=Dreissena polymorpha TaxID=45954 RepID=A0A9D4CH59_DREPO|nr:hypothetical protein DPMN_050096 [Dreissena polymorpha]
MEEIIRLLPEKNAQPLGGYIFQATGTIFELVQDFIGTNLLTMFYDDRTIIMASRVLTRFYNSYVILGKMPPPPDGHVFKTTETETIFELIQDIIGTNLLTKFHEDRNINVASRVLTRKKVPPPGDYVFKTTGIIFKLVQDIIGINLLIRFHEDRKINPYIAIRKKVPPLGSHVLQANVTIFELIQDIIKTNLLTNFHEDWTIHVASRVLTRKMLTPKDARRTKGDHNVLMVS